MFVKRDVGIILGVDDQREIRLTGARRPRDGVDVQRAAQPWPLKPAVDRQATDSSGRQ